MVDIERSASLARAAAPVVAQLTADAKDSVLRSLADAIERHSEAILTANRADVEAARLSGLDEPKLARLSVTESSLLQLATGLRAVAALPDPVGTVTRDSTTTDGLRVRKVRSPLGVICMIYEARPGVTAEAFALCFKAGNACILKGGKEAARSNAAIAELIWAVLDDHGVPREAAVVLPAIGREELRHLLTLDRSIDLVIPRGGKELIRFVREHSKIPTVQHFEGVNHIFVDESADAEMSRDICLSAKVRAPATCNACECVLVHRAVADTFVPAMVDTYRRHGVEVRGGPLVAALAPGAIAASPEDFGREFLSLTVAMRVVDGLDAAIDHIRRYGSNHTEAILTRDDIAAAEFCRRVDASCVVVNGSTRLNDGFTLGLGAEIGISTSRIHAYGPMGLEELTTQRFIVLANGQTR